MAYNYIENKSELNTPLIFNSEILKDIIKNYYENENESDENKYSDEFIDEIIELTDENSDIIFYDSENNFISFNESGESYEILCLKYTKFSSDASYSIMNLFNLFNEIISVYDSYFRNYLYDSMNQIHYNGMKYNNSSCYELIEYILSELNEKIYYESIGEIKDIQIILNINSSYLYSNNIINFNDYFLSDEISNRLFESDLYESDLYDLYESNILDISYDYNIDEIKLFNESYIEYLNYEFNTELEYIRKDELTESEILKLSVNDLLKLNEIISESDEYKLSFKIDSIDELTESVNNLSDENFLFSMIDNIYESLYSGEYEYYYELYSINSSKYKFKKIYSIFELIELVLNELKHYNLNKSFKFNKSVYELY